MPFYSNDLSAVNAEDEQGAIKVYRRPVPFLVETKGAIAQLYKIENGEVDKEKTPITIPLVVFQAHFMSWPESKNSKNIYCRQPNFSHAVKIERNFHIDTLSCDDELVNTKGHSGDYLITKESGENEMCRKEDFDKTFILSTEWEKLLSVKPSFEDDSPSL